MTLVQQITDQQILDQFTRDFELVRDQWDFQDHYAIEQLCEFFGKHTALLLPLVHQAYIEYEPDEIRFLPYIVLEYLPDAPTVEYLLRTDERVAKERLMELLGFVEYLRRNGDPFQNRDMSMFAKSEEERLLSHSSFPKDNLSEDKTNKEVLRNGVIRVQHPKSLWRNQKERKFNSFIDRDGRIFRGAKVMWPATMHQEAIDKQLRWARSLLGEFEDPGVRYFSDENGITFMGLLQEDKSYRVFAVSWTQAR